MSIMPILSTEAQTQNPVKVTQEIVPEATSFDVSDNTVSIKLNSNDDVIKTAKGKPAPAPKSYALTLEIDYIQGHMPTDSVLNYMTAYYAQQNIKLTIKVDQMVPYEDKFANGISDAEFWEIQINYNQGDDFAINANDGKYTLPEKWVLYGTTVEGSDSVVGYTYCIGSRTDLVAGNYIFIADKLADDWATQRGIQTYGAEAVVLMHEFGHSIGICVVRAGSEVYCSDYYCVMSYLRPENAGNLDKWYYCSNHWKTKNIDYYVV
ncbi:MAG: hypothetical protein NWE95_05965 [Candidatus Bathyarchaeota archaeon]|nr:hypothetical protein [Candidatus Bathyarchaeota archaeon]